MENSALKLTAKECEMIEIEKEYLNRILQVAQRATRNASFYNFSMSVTEDSFVFVDRNAQIAHKVPFVNESDSYELDELEYALNQIDRERQEAQRIDKIKRDALAKLSPEERKVLNV
jgi:hypothetical protein